jgi:GNAT superfamily N-acetyltransferase
VRLAADSDHAEIIAVLSRAFWDDPLFDFLSAGDLLREYCMLPRVFDSAMADFRSEFAELFVADVSGKPRSFAGWLAPGAFPRSRTEQLARELRAAVLLMNLRNRRSAAALLREVERRHPTEDHWYLALLGTDPSAQGRGLGGALLQPILQRCDTQGTPAYTETQKLENVGWYARFGFIAMDVLKIANAPTIWRLWRDPQPSNETPI